MDQPVEAALRYFAAPISTRASGRRAGIARRSRAAAPTTSVFDGLPAPTGIYPDGLELRPIPPRVSSADTSPGSWSTRRSLHIPLATFGSKGAICSIIATNRYLFARRGTGGLVGVRRCVASRSSRSSRSGLSAGRAGVVAESIVPLSVVNVYRLRTVARLLPDASGSGWLRYNRDVVDVDGGR